MLRVLFSVLAVVVAVLAVVLEQPILYAAAAVLLLIALALVMSSMRRQRRDEPPPYASRPLPSTASSEPDLKSLGIMEIRPKQPAATAPVANGAPPPKADGPAPDDEVQARPMKVYGLPTGEPVAQAEQQTAPASKPDASARGALEACLDAVCAALGAGAACLLKQEDFSLDYRVVAGVGGARPSGHVFSTPAPLLAAHMARQAVTVRAVEAGDLDPACLGYRDGDGVREVALAPVPAASETDFYILLADAAEDEALRSRYARTLMVQFADVLSTLLDVPPPAVDEPRSRLEIIAEEMDRARTLDRDLALALVYLNRAEDVSALGAAAVGEAEHLLDERLRRATRHGRIERFGEMTYGVFLDGSVREVEAWSTRAQQALQGGTGALGGGVSIGIAILQDRHQSADAFRADATEALREAFVSGTCTILE